MAATTVEDKPRRQPSELFLPGRVVAGVNLGYANIPGKLLWVILAMQLAPLLLLAPGLLLGTARAHAWACFVVNLYFIQGVLAAFDPSKALYGWLLTGLSLSLFCAALMFTRWRFQYERKLAGEI
jgi:uncharacterized membrane protein